MLSIGPRTSERCKRRSVAAEFRRGRCRYGFAELAQDRCLAANYEGVVGLLTKVIGARLGSGFGTFFFGFFTSRLRASLFPMPNSMPQFCNFATAATLCESHQEAQCRIRSRNEPQAPKQFNL